MEPAANNGGPSGARRDAGVGGLCAEHDQPGCACSDEGSHLVCGKVVTKLHGQTVCGKGVSVCTNGSWSECVLNASDLSTVTISEQSPGGLRTQSLGGAVTCSSNPCDPYCVTYTDNTQGLTDAGVNVVAKDSGLSTTPKVTTSCTPATCAKLGKNCGPVADGCGGLLGCGSCTAPQTCGGAGTPSLCGTPTPPNGPCVPKTCANLGASCGPAGDGCGGLLQCGNCTAPQSCGGAGVPSQCGMPASTCTPQTCASLGKNCGPVSDTCGGLLNCGTCMSPQTCGGGGIASVCGPAPCVPKTCAQLSKDCGPVSDGCGGLLNCGSCTFPQVCGGAGTANVCGTNSACTNLCAKQVRCPGGGTTSLSGTVYAPNGVDPIPDAIVYVPNAPITPFSSSVSCDNCAQASGSPLVGQTTGVDGTFRLTNVPVGSNIPLVVQLGHWRRQVTIPTVSQCANTVLPASMTRLPRNQGEGDIPKQAFVTGKVDALECVLRKIGVDDSEFTNPLGNGRIHLYAVSGSSGTVYGTFKGGVGPSAASALTPSGTTEWDYRLLDTHSWFMGAAMSYSRAFHAAVALQDGRVLVVGGEGASGNTATATTLSLKSVEIYDPSANTWTTKTSMSTARTAPTATLLSNGNVLVTGGVTTTATTTTYQSSAELYNPTTDTWTPAGTMTGSVGRAYHTATLLTSGKVLVAGGTTNGTASTTLASLYDPTANTWTATAGAMPTGHFLHTATLMRNGKVLVAGGVTSGTTSVSTAATYDPTTNTFTATTSAMPAVRQQHTASLLSNGKVLLVGGVGSSTTTIATTALYDPTAGSWSAGPSIATARRAHVAATLSDGTVVVAGGIKSTTYVTSEETYDPTANSWSVVGYGQNYGHVNATATVLPNGRVVMTGGGTSGGSLFGYTEIFVNQPINQYDIALFPCPGTPYNFNSTLQTRFSNNIANYANVGGRVFTTHYTYTWLNNDGTTYFSPLSPAVNWNVGQTAPTPDPQTAYIDQSFPKGALLAQWLMLPAISASTTLGQISVNTLRRDYNSVNVPTTNWTTINQPTTIPMHFTFNTPLNAQPTNQCGRVVFSDFHVENATNTQYEYPAECSNTAMTAQEKLLEFMMFDLASCVSPDSPSACVPQTCTGLGLNCGQAGDGCGGTLDCGTCPSGQVCGWGNAPNICTVPVACVPITCASLGLSCGQAGDGCGGTLNCGSCPSGQVCGAGGPGLCGTPSTSCAPTTCAALGLSCGPAGDGCGSTLDCGSCTAPDTCGGGGQRGQCGHPPPCVPTTCSAQGVSCGSAGDGCGAMLACGSCTAPDTCGGAGMPGQCGHLTTYSTGTFVRDYVANCPTGMSAWWSLWSWNATTPSDAHIDFTVQTATTAAGLATAPADALLFSNPPGPAALSGQAASAHASNHPTGTPDTEIGSLSVDDTFVAKGRARNNPYVRITSTLVPSSDKKQTALLASWNLQLDCIPDQ
jgi:N-acetylneuraminic acid mutarotase